MGRKRWAERSAWVRGSSSQAGEQQEETELGRTVPRACTSLPNSENPGLPRPPGNSKPELRGWCVCSPSKQRQGMRARGWALGSVGTEDGLPPGSCDLGPASPQHWPRARGPGCVADAPNTAVAPQPTRGDEAGAEARQGASPLLLLLQRWPLDRGAGKTHSPGLPLTGCVTCYL